MWVMDHAAVFIVSKSECCYTYVIYVDDMVFNALFLKWNINYKLSLKVEPPSKEIFWVLAEGGWRREKCEGIGYL